MDSKFQETDYKGRVVTCTKSQWNTHIASGHPIMAGNVGAVKDTIKNPDIVYQSSQNSEREVYFKSSSFSTYGKTLMTKVIVEYTDDQKGNDIIGKVVTAFPTKEVKGGISNAIYSK